MNNSKDQIELMNDINAEIEAGRNGNLDISPFETPRKWAEANAVVRFWGISAQAASLEDSAIDALFEQSMKHKDKRASELIGATVNHVAPILEPLNAALTRLAEARLATETHLASPEFQAMGDADKSKEVFGTEEPDEETTQRVFAPLNVLFEEYTNAGQAVEACQEELKQKTARYSLWFKEWHTAHTQGAPMRCIWNECDNDAKPDSCLCGFHFSRSVVSKTPVRSIPRIACAPFGGSVRIPTAAPVHDALTALMSSPQRWMTSNTQNAIYTYVQKSEVAIDCDNEIGFSPENAVHRIAKHGPALAQTFIAMVNLWVRENKGKHYETYMTARASDLLRAQGRYANSGGFPLEDQIEKGRQVYTLFRLHVPRTVENVYGARTVKKQSKLFGPLVIGQGIEIASDSRDEVVTFRFHLAGDVMEAVCGDNGEYAELSSRLVEYHPDKDKYQILIGFSLAYYDRVNRSKRRTLHPISLPALLKMACIEMPERNAYRFLTQIETAINDLEKDGVIPGLRLEKPENWTELLAARKARDIISGSKLEFPRMIAIPDPAPARVAARNSAK